MGTHLPLAPTAKLWTLVAFRGLWDRTKPHLFHK